jgi:hypothetical protein
VTFARDLVPGQHYQICEILMPGWTTSLPNQFQLTIALENTRQCTDFVAEAGNTITFNVDNTSPGGKALTIGFWKNWSSCKTSGGKQAPVLDQTLAKANVIGDVTHVGHSTLPGIVVSATSGVYDLFGSTYYLVLHGSTATPNKAPDCLSAVRLLDKSTINTGTKKASDPAFNMAAQLVAAELNYTAGAGQTTAASSAINQAVLLLGKYHFDGKTHTAISAADKATMNTLATILDNYNNNI